jgi:PKD repeat protein
MLVLSDAHESGQASAHGLFAGRRRGRVAARSWSGTRATDRRLRLGAEARRYRNPRDVQVHFDPVRYVHAARGQPMGLRWDRKSDHGDGESDDGNGEADDGDGKFEVRSPDGVATATAAAPGTNQPPNAAFAALTASPLVREEVTFVSYSDERDGRIIEQAWDMNGDGIFDDATGPVATRTFSAPGERTVMLRVADDKRAVSTLSRTVVVREQAAASVTGPSGPKQLLTAPTPPPPPRLLSPFPIVRLVGSLIRAGLASACSQSGRRRGRWRSSAAAGEDVRSSALRSSSVECRRGSLPSSASCLRTHCSRRSFAETTASGSTPGSGCGRIASRNGPTAACCPALLGWRRALRADTGQATACHHVRSHGRGRRLGGPSRVGMAAPRPAGSPYPSTRRLARESLWESTAPPCGQARERPGAGRDLASAEPPTSGPFGRRHRGSREATIAWGPERGSAGGGSRRRPPARAATISSPFAYREASRAVVREEESVSRELARASSACLTPPDAAAGLRSHRRRQRAEDVPVSPFGWLGRARLGTRLV